jgi:hypothetical protein
MFLEAHFGDVSNPNTGEEEDWLVMDVKVDDTVARVDLISMVRFCLQNWERKLISLARGMRLGGPTHTGRECHGNGVGYHETSVESVHEQWRRYDEDGDGIDSHMSVELPCTICILRLCWR